MASAAFLLCAEEFHQNFGFSPRKLIDGVSLGGQVYKTSLVDLVPIFNPDRPYVAQRAFEPA
jgi:hypothetical protein